MYDIIDNLYAHNYVDDDSILQLLKNNDSGINDYLYKVARKSSHSVFSNGVYIRGLIEISNICKNDCMYCGIRASNSKCDRYRLYKNDILKRADKGYLMGFRTFVLQGGEDLYYDDDTLCDIIFSLKNKFPDCAITLSMGERSTKSYKELFSAGADRYLLRHETADKSHYEKLHPKNMSYENRIRCLYDLKKIGFQTGCGFMVGSPYQTLDNIVSDLRFIKKFSPHMCGIGPFIPHKDTPFASFKSGSFTLTLKLLAIIRLMLPHVLLPATTALNSISRNGHTAGILSGANVIMPNLSPPYVRSKYMLYNNKSYSGYESADEVDKIIEEMSDIGYKVVVCRGDYK